MASSNMFSRKTLKSFVKKRLCAAAEDIFVVVERILTEYEEQAFSSKQKIEQQQRILDVVLKPQIKLHRTDIPEKRQRIIEKTIDVEDEDEGHDDEDFPGFPALDDSLEHEDILGDVLEEPQSPPQGQAETGWSALRLLDRGSRDDTLSAEADFTVQEDTSPPEIKEEPEELLIIPQMADTSSSTTSLTSPDRMSGACPETERRGTNGAGAKRGRGRPRGRPRRVYHGRPRGRPPGSKTPDSCARTNTPGYVRSPAVSHPIYPISQVTERQEPNGAVPVAKRGRGRPRKVHRGRAVSQRQEASHRNNTGSLYLSMLKEEAQEEEEEEESSSSLDCGTSQPPAEEQLLCPLSYHSDTEDDDDDRDDWEQTREEAPPVRKSRRKVKREAYTEDGSDSEQTWKALPARRRKRKIKRERSSSVIDEPPRDLKSPTHVKSEELTRLARAVTAVTAAKALFCTFCGKKFPSSSGLKLHVMIHTGEKPFGCRFCDKHFRLKGNARLHERTHTGEKPFSCPFCGQRFSQKCNMVNHTKKMLCFRKAASLHQT